MSNPTQPLDTGIDEILANAKANEVQTMNCIIIAPNAKEIELLHTGQFKDGDVVNVRINNYPGHLLYVGKLDGNNLHINKKIPYQINVGTPITLVTWPEAKAALKALIARETTAAELRGRIDELKLWNTYGHPNFHQSNDLMNRIDALQATINVDGQKEGE